MSVSTSSARPNEGAQAEGAPLSDSLTIDEFVLLLREQRLDDAKHAFKHVVERKDYLKEGIRARQPYALALTSSHVHVEEENISLVQRVAAMQEELNEVVAENEVLRTEIKTLKTEIAELKEADKQQAKDTQTLIQRFESMVAMLQQDGYPVSIMPQ